jgi:hypothetical protein
MTLSTDPAWGKLMKQPHTVMFLLDTYEGLADVCEQMMQGAREQAGAGESQFERSRKLYQKRVGVDFTQRGQLREAAGKVIESACEQAGFRRPI